MCQKCNIIVFVRQLRSARVGGSKQLTLVSARPLWRSSQWREVKELTGFWKQPELCDASRLYYTFRVSNRLNSFCVAS